MDRVKEWGRNNVQAQPQVRPRVVEAKVVPMGLAQLDWAAMFGDEGIVLPVGPLWSLWPSARWRSP